MSAPNFKMLKVQLFSHLNRYGDRGVQSGRISENTYVGAWTMGFKLAAVQI